MSSIQNSYGKSLSFHISLIPVGSGWCCITLPYSKPMSTAWCGGKEYLGQCLLHYYSVNILERWLVLLNRDPLSGHWIRHRLFHRAASPSECLVHAGERQACTSTWRTLRNAGRKASGFEEGEFFVDKVSLMYL